MGIIQRLGYDTRKPNAAQIGVQHIAATRPGAWFFGKTLHHLDRALLRLTRGQVTVPAVLAGLSVLTVTTRTPGWYYNMRADPKVEVTYRNQTITAIAREATGEEAQAVWERARAICLGVDSYKDRIKNREIHIMILGTGSP